MTVAGSEASSGIFSESWKRVMKHGTSAAERNVLRTLDVPSLGGLRYLIVEVDRLCYTDEMDGSVLGRLFEFISLLESGALREAHTTYITTGEYPPQVRDLEECLKRSGLCPQDVDWMDSIEEQRPFLQSPEKILSADSATVTKLVGMASNAEQLNKSFFPHLCSSGFMLMLLKRLKDLVYQ